MSAATVETLDISICTTESQSSSARAEASRANGRLSRGPTSPEGKDRSRRNGCKDGLTGKGIVLPPDAEAEVDRREAEFARTFRPTDEVERALVRQMALGAWRGEELARRIIRHDARTGAARITDWEHEGQLAAVELGRKLRDDPEAIVARLLGSSAGCDWLIDRWTLLGHGLTTDDGDGPGCAWTDADLTLALDLLGRRAELRHLDPRTKRLERLHAQARAGSAEGENGLREIIAQEVTALERRREAVWEGVEEPRLEDWRSGMGIDLGPEGTRLRRYEAAANRLFRSAWTKLEQLRKERDEPFIPPCERESAAEPAARPAPPAAPSSAKTPPAAMPSCPEIAFPPSSLRGEPAAPVLDFSVGGSPRPAMSSANSSRDKTNPAPCRHAKRGRDLLISSLA
jgi:hypothetical protein